MEILGVTLARGGSKGIRRKNLQKVGSKPLLQWSIDAMSKSNLLTDYIVSTEDREIASLCEEQGVKVHHRDPDLAQDHTTSAEVLIVMANKYKPDIIIECMCTAPFTTTKNIDEFIGIMLREKCEHIVSVVLAGHYHPSRLKYIQDNKLLPFFPEAIEARRQDLQPQAFIRNGALYGMTTEALFRSASKWGLAPRPYIMSSDTYVNIDTPRDLSYARWLYENTLSTHSS